MAHLKLSLSISRVGVKEDVIGNAGVTGYYARRETPVNFVVVLSAIGRNMYTITSRKFSKCTNSGEWSLVIPMYASLAWSLGSKFWSQTADWMNLEWCFWITLQLTILVSGCMASCTVAGIVSMLVSIWKIVSLHRVWTIYTITMPIVNCGCSMLFTKSFFKFSEANDDRFPDLWFSWILIHVKMDPHEMLIELSGTDSYGQSKSNEHNFNNKVEVFKTVLFHFIPQRTYFSILYKYFTSLRTLQIECLLPMQVLYLICIWHDLTPNNA